MTCSASCVPCFPPVFVGHVRVSGVVDGIDCRQFFLFDAQTRASRAQIRTPCFRALPCSHRMVCWSTSRRTILRTEHSRFQAAFYAPISNHSFSKFSGTRSSLGSSFPSLLSSQVCWILSTTLKLSDSFTSKRATRFDVTHRADSQ